MAGKVVQGELHLVVAADLGRAILAQTKEFTVESLADAIHSAYCEQTAFKGTSGELHRRQHIEIARMIFEKGA